MQIFSSNDFQLGILGGGQLGRMLIAEAIRFDIQTSVMDSDPNAPAFPIANDVYLGDINIENEVYQFGKSCQLMTIEIEAVNTIALRRLEEEGVLIFPQPHAIEILQNKLYQKQFYENYNIPTAPFFYLENPLEIKEKKFLKPLVQKTCTAGYDGKGVFILRNEYDFQDLLMGPSIFEDFIPNALEISVIVAKNKRGEIHCYPPVEMVFHPTANLVEYLVCPARINVDLAKKAEEIAKKVINSLNLIGILAVEMFITPEGEILVNESAPRPHNSGHHTLESSFTSQYEQHLRAILNLPLGSVQKKTDAVMINLLGEPGYSGKVKYLGIEEVLEIPGVMLHIYGKKETRPFRKMGHITILDSNVDEALSKANWVKNKLKVIA